VFQIKEVQESIDKEGWSDWCIWSHNVLMWLVHTVEQARCAVGLFPVLYYYFCRLMIINFPRD